MSLDIKHSGEQFYIGEYEEPDAYIHFVEFGSDKFIIDHTYVGESLRGQGIGEKLVDAVAGHARKEGRKIIAHCPYARSVLTDNDSYDDIFIGIRSSS